MRARQIRPPARSETLSLPCPEVECIGKAKTNAPYQFGVKRPSPPPPMSARPAESGTLQHVASHRGEDRHFMVGADCFAGRQQMHLSTHAADGCARRRTMLGTSRAPKPHLSG